MHQVGGPRKEAGARGCVLYSPGDHGCAVWPWVNHLPSLSLSLFLLVFSLLHTTWQMAGFNQTLLTLSGGSFLVT